MIISIESLHRLTNNGDIKHYDFIINDEIVTLLTTVFASTIDNQRTCFEHFLIILRRASKIISMDVDLDNRSIEFINHVTSQHRILKNVYKGPPRKYFQK